MEIYKVGPCEVWQEELKQIENDYLWVVYAYETGVSTEY